MAKDVTDEKEAIMFITDKHGTAEKRVVEELVKNLYICYIPSEEKKVLPISTYHLKSEDEFKGLDALSEQVPDEYKEIEVPEAYEVFLLNLGLRDIEKAEYSIFRMFDPDNPGERAMLWTGKAEKLPPNSATTPTVKFDEDFGYHDVFGWTLTVKGLRDKVHVSYSDLRACGMFRNEDYKDIPAFNKKGYLYKVEKSEKAQRDMVFSVGWEKIEPDTEVGAEKETEYNVEYFRYPQRKADTKPSPE
jgi:hypothetical protein